LLVFQHAKIGDFVIVIVHVQCCFSCCFLVVHCGECYFSLLLIRGANMQLLNVAGETPLMVSVRSNLCFPRGFVITGFVDWQDH